MIKSQKFHTPVLINQVLSFLNIQKDAKYIDATLGGGGHTKAIVENGGIVLGIDQDEEALEFVKTNLESRIQNSELRVVKGNFRDIKRIAEGNGFEKVSGILFDFGVSSHQLDTLGRGFSIKHDDVLDMRMDHELQIKAEDIVNTYSEEELSDIFMKFGEEDKAREIAGAILFARKIKRIDTTTQLVQIIKSIKKQTGKLNPATQVFQALRIEVNGELTAIKEGLSSSLDLLNSNGRIAVISFHSLEDRITKQMFSVWEGDKKGRVITKKPITADVEEEKSNPRARSAKLRVFEKI